MASRRAAWGQVGRGSCSSRKAVGWSYSCRTVKIFHYIHISTYAMTHGTSYMKHATSYTEHE